MEEENLYKLIEDVVKQNRENKRKSEKVEEQARNYANIKDRYYIVTSEIKAYFYYKYFIENIFSEYLKEQISNSKDININKVKDRYFRLYLQVDYHSKNEVYIKKFAKAAYISFNEPIVCKFFNEYMEGFSKSLGISKEGFSDVDVFGFEEITIRDVLEAYYMELLRFGYTDELIKSVQEEENTFVNGEEVIKGIRKR